MGSVKDIRAMFRGGPDYKNFGKPLRPIQPTKPKKLRKNRNSSCSSTNSTGESGCDTAAPRMTSINEQMNAPVSAKVMNLFRGAFEFDDKPDTNVGGTTVENGQKMPPVPPTRTISKQKPFIKPGTNGANSTAVVTAATNGAYYRHQEEEKITAKEDFKTSIDRIKSESALVDSFEDSLDAFYDVFDELKT